MRCQIYGGLAASLEDVAVHTLMGLVEVGGSDRGTLVAGSDSVALWNALLRAVGNCGEEFRGGPACTRQLFISSRRRAGFGTLFLEFPIFSAAAIF